MVNTYPGCINAKRHYISWIKDLVGWIQINLLPQSFVWLLGFGANHSLLFFVQYFTAFYYMKNSRHTILLFASAYN